MGLFFSIMFVRIVNASSMPSFVLELVFVFNPVPLQLCLCSVTLRTPTPTASSPPACQWGRTSNRLSSPTYSTACALSPLLSSSSSVTRLSTHYLKALPRRYVVHQDNSICFGIVGTDDGSEVLLPWIQVSLPAVSQICSLMRFPSIFKVRNLKSTPIVGTKYSLNWLSTNRSSREDFPTPDYPAMTIFNSLSIGWNIYYNKES